MTRSDIQGLRGIAIISVIAFHIWPNHFPNGYIGVDIFFVLSGFLMALIFSKTEKFTFESVFNFYYRRVKRIFPLYYLCLLFIFIFANFFLSKFWIDMTMKNGMYSAILMKNMRVIWDDSDYFTQFESTSFDRDVFLHTWSLCVEIQFYVIAPAIFFALHFLKKPIYKIALLSSISFAAFIQYNNSNPIYAFNSSITRLWQFCAGMIAFIVSEILMYDKDYNNESRFWSIAGLLATSFFGLIAIPHVASPIILRPVITIATAFLLTMNPNDVPKIFSWSILVYIGDLSYALYLVHWPVISIISTETTHMVYTVIVITVVLSMLVHYCFEKIYLKYNGKQISALLIVLLSAYAATYYTFENYPEMRMYSKSLKEDPRALIGNALEKNYGYTVKSIVSRLHCQSNRSTKDLAEFALPWGLCDFPVGTGQTKVLVLGNSYGINQAGMIMNLFKGNYSTFQLFSNHGMSTLYNGYKPPYFTPEQDTHNLMLRIVESLKPDIIFLTTRYNEDQKAPFLNVTDDAMLREYNTNIAELEKHCQKLFIQGPHPMYPLAHLNSFIDSLDCGRDLEKHHVSKAEADIEMIWSRARVSAIQCSKCKVYDTSSAFVSGKWYLGYDLDTLISYMDNDIHFTPDGLERMHSVYQQLIDSL